MAGPAALRETGSDASDLAVSLRAVTKVYDRHSYDKEKRAALLKWDRRIGGLISSEPSRARVIELRAS